MTDETVADVLREVCDDECWKMIDRVEMPEMAQPEMGYEDWVRPMKLTGGRVCLRVSDAAHDEEWFYTMEGAGLYYNPRAPFKSVGPPRSVAFLKRDLDSDVDVTPVLRADTPFAEGDDG